MWYIAKCQVDRESDDMTSRQLTATITADAIERFPYFPPRDDMQNPIHLSDPALQSALRVHFGNSDTTLVLGEVPVSRRVPKSRAGVRVPDLMVAFDVDRADIIERSGYAIDLVGKPPDFALEVASPNTARNDYTVKRRDYERFGIPEYWRFDPTGGDLYDAALAGDQLVDGRYEPIPMEWVSEDMGRGYSRILGLYLCWEDGWLRFYDPQRGRYLPTYDDQADEIAHVADRAERAERAAAREANRADREAEENRRLRQQLRDLGHPSE